MDSIFGTKTRSHKKEMVPRFIGFFFLPLIHTHTRWSSTHQFHWLNAPKDGWMLVESGEMVRAWFTLIYCHVLTGVEQGGVVSEKEKKKRTKGLLCVGNYYFCTFPTSISYLWLVLARYMKPIVTADEDNFFRLASFWKISIGLYWYKNKVYFPRFSNILYPNKCKPEIVLFCGLKCKALGMPEMFPGTICVSLCFLSAAGGMRTEREIEQIPS